MEGSCECCIESPGCISHGVSIYIILCRADNIRMYLKEICINTRNWVDLARGRDYWKTPVNAALNLRVP